jgi:REP element-mobilizing transposase RayT
LAPFLRGHVRSGHVRGQTPDMCLGSAESAPEACPQRMAPGGAAYARSVPRPPRPQIPGGVYHVGTRGVRREKLFANPCDYDLFGSIFGRVVEGFEWRCHTYCLMPNHYHLLVETPAPNLSAGMQRLNGVYAQWFNHLYGLSGHVFERRFFSRLVESSYDLLELARYVVLNPVRAGLCDDPPAGDGAVTTPSSLTRLAPRFSRPSGSCHNSGATCGGRGRTSARSSARPWPFRPWPGSDPGRGRFGHLRRPAQPKP